MDALHHEYVRWKFMNRITKVYQDYEYKNIIERWVLSMANLTVNVTTNDPLFRITNKTDLINRKLESELIDKQLLNARDARECMGILVDMVNCFCRNITAFITQEPIIKQEELLIDEDDDFIKLRDFTAKLPKQKMRKMLLLSRSAVKTATMVIRYSTLGLGSQQWSVPTNVYETLHRDEAFRISAEGFTSPLNSQLLEIQPSSPVQICTLFWDVDHPFGSRGSFYTALITENIVVNPPFIEEILDAAARKCVYLAEVKGLTAIFIMPHWIDSKAYKIVKKAAQWHAVLKKNQHRYYDSGSDKNITAKFKSIVAVFCPEDRYALEDYERLASYFRSS